MKKITALILFFTLAFCFTSCGNDADSANGSQASSSLSKPESSSSNKSDDERSSDDITEELNSEPPETSSFAGERTLVAYFSCGGNTKAIAEKISEITDSDVYEIVPEVPYTAADLDYNTDCRANREQNDSGARPSISGKIDDISKYDTIFIGYPIWWGKAPKIISTFLESYDFSGKTIIPFCTSGSSPIGSSATELHELASGASWIDGTRFSGGASRETVEEWINGIFAAFQTNVMEITIGNTVLKADLVDNSSVEALKNLLKAGLLTINMRDYGGMEKVGSIGTDLPRNDEKTTTEAGDIILYQGNSLAIYYDTNSWDFTRIGKINGVTKETLIGILGEGDATITFSLAD